MGPSKVFVSYTIEVNEEEVVIEVVHIGRMRDFFNFLGVGGWVAVKN